jgi:hypothetical protein
MLKSRAVLAAVLVIGSVLLLAAFTSVHKAQSEMQGDSHFAKSTMGDALPEAWSKLGVQLIHSSTGEKEGHGFVEQFTRELRREGIAQVAVLPSKVDLSGAGEELEGLLLLSLHKFNVEGWQLNRRGKVTVNFHFVPLKGTVIDSIRGGTLATGTATGWVNKAAFTGQLEQFAAGKTAEKIMEALNSTSKTHTEGAGGYPVEVNVGSLPVPVAGFVPTDADAVSYIGWNNSFTLSYITEEGNLETFLSRQLEDGLNLELAYDWVDSDGARRRAEYFDAGNGQVVEAFYVYLDDVVEGGSLRSPRREPSGPKLVTIIKRPNPLSY